MKCNELQDIILTDYLDGETDKTTNGAIREHLKTCVLCREFAARATEIAKPFEKVTRLEPPQELWKSIQSAIRQEKLQTTSHQKTSWHRLAQWFSFSRPALASFAMLILLVSGLYLYGERPRHSQSFNPEIQVDYMTSLLDEDVTDENVFAENSEGEEGFGTLIEEYFL